MKGAKESAHSMDDGCGPVEWLDPTVELHQPGSSKQSKMDVDSPDVLVGTTKCQEHETNNSNELLDDSGFRWPHEAILLLLEEYQKREHILRKGKTSHKKFWAVISRIMGEYGHQVSGPQCQSKFGGLKKTYKNIKDHNSRSGKWCKTWPYLNLMNDLMRDKPFVSPLAPCSSETVACKRAGSESDTEFTDSTDHFRRRAATKRTYTSPVKKFIQAMDERRKQANKEKQIRHRQREENKRIRHEENMQRKDRALELLAELLKER